MELVGISGGQTSHRHWILLLHHNFQREIAFSFISFIPILTTSKPLLWICKVENSNQQFVKSLLIIIFLGMPETFLECNNRPFGANILWNRSTLADSKWSTCTSFKKKFHNLSNFQAKFSRNLFLFLKTFHMCKPLSKIWPFNMYYLKLQLYTRSEISHVKITMHPTPCFNVEIW